MEISDELTNLIYNHINTEEIKEKQINQLLDMAKSWMSVMQKELDSIEGVKVRN